MSTYTDTFYARTLTENRDRPALQGAVRADVCVIGGGLAGLNVGLGLAERGKKAVVLEGRRVGFGASGRNGGKVLTGYAAGFEKIVRRVGIAQAKELYALTVDSMALVRKRIAEFNIDCELEDGVLIASWYDDPAGTRAEMEFEINELGLRAEYLPREQLRELYRTKRYYDGIVYPDYFHFHPLKYTRGIATAFEDKGGVIYEDSMALHVREEESGFTVTTAHGSVRADEIVYCGSAYTNNIEPRLKRASVQISSYMMATENLPREKLQTAIRAYYGVYDTRWALDYYRVVSDGNGGGRILWGGGVGIGTHHLPRNLDQKLMGSLLKVYPQLEGIKVESSWVGTMASTVHRMPHIGRFKPGVWFCTNFGNNGLGPTAAGGEVIAAAIAQGDETYKLFEPFGLEYTGGVLGPYVAQAIYRRWQLRDKIAQWRHDKQQKLA